MGSKSGDEGGTVGCDGCGELTGITHQPPWATNPLLH